MPLLASDVWQRYASVSTVSVALWRITLGLVSAANAAHYWRSADVFCSPDGVLPTSWLHFTSPLTWLTAAWQRDAYFLVTIGACLCLAAGVRGSRWIAPLLSAVYFERLHPLVTGGHAVLQLMMVLTWFLPVTHNISVESWRRTGNVQGREQTVSAVGYPLILLQLSLIYVLNAWHKFSPDWLSGRAVELALNNPTYASTLGGYFQDLPQHFYRTATYGTLVVESLLPVLLLSPVARRTCHWIALVLMLLLHGSIAITMEVGLFSWAMLAQIPILVPRPAQEPLSFPTSKAGRFAHTAGAILLAYVSLHSVSNPEDRGGFNWQGSSNPIPFPTTPANFARALNLTQSWGMFLAPSDMSFVTVTRARTLRGRVFDPWRERAADDPSFATRSPRSAFKHNSYRSYEKRFLLKRQVGPFSQWMMRQHWPEDPGDVVQSFESWTLTVPAVAEHRLVDEAIDRAAGVYPTPLGGALPVRLESFGVFEPQRTIDGLMVAEGSNALTPTGSALTPRCAHLTYHLTQPTRVRQILIQSDAYDHLLIEGSEDGKKYIRLGESPQILKRHYRTRLVDVDGPPVRSIRIRNFRVRPGSGHINEVALYSERRTLPSLPVLPVREAVANHERPEARGIASGIVDGCPWERPPETP